MRPPSVSQNLATPSFQSGTPYLGHNSRTPFLGSESSGSCAPSLGPGGNYGQLLGPAHHQPHMMPHLGFKRGPLYHDSAGIDSDFGQNPPDGDSPDNDGTKPSTNGAKKTVCHNISNKHHALKGLLHPLFYDLCNVNSNLAKSKCIKLLCNIKPLETGKPFEIDKDGRKIWFPKWQANVDDDINAAFIQEVITLMWNNEKDLHDKNGKGEIPDSTYETGIISECTKAYFQNIHKQYKELNNAELGLKALAWKTNSKHHSRRQAAMNRHRKAAKVYKNETGIQGVMAILDTDFALDILSYASDQELSKDTLERRKEAGVGEGADMVAGLQWRSPDFVAFGCWLTLKNKRDPDNANMNEPAAKRRKVIKKKLTKNTFDLAPSKMSKDPPFASKKTVPFKSMIAKSWMEKYPDTVFLEGGEWLDGFYEKHKDEHEDFYKQDLVFLQELNEWHEQGDLSSEDEQTGADK
ncbi:hypothetical protein BDR07DRAFT_1501183 [Suillus spraguei]|nr:hypothetical protein BDR07DRAFT_1501183 [Suillus spraguei]